jgi:GNAT superfamily N-acetyltransferase
MSARTSPRAVAAEFRTRPLAATDAHAAAELVRHGFNAYVAPEWDEVAAKEFLANELSTERMGRLIAESAFTAGAFGAGDALRGVVILPRPSWLALMFVDPGSLRAGIGRLLWEQARQYLVAADPPVAVVELNASGFALGFYLRLGFVAGEKLDKQGRRGTRMTWRVRP